MASLPAQPYAMHPSEARNLSWPEVPIFVEATLEHTVGGISAILCGTIAYAISRKETGHKAKYRVGALCALLALLAAGKLPIAFALVVLSLLVQVAVTKLQNTRPGLPPTIEKERK